MKHVEIIDGVHYPKTSSDSVDKNVLISIFPSLGETSCNIYIKVYHNKNEIVLQKQQV